MRRPSRPRPADPLQGRTPIGAQPDRIVINPSRAYPWYGAWRPGDRFTEAQLYIIRRLGRDPVTIDTITVHREATTREMWWPTTQLPPVFAFDCPVLARGPEQVRIVAPDGTGKRIAASGWVGPCTRRGW